jgi:hypothetical protein
VKKVSFCMASIALAASAFLVNAVMAEERAKDEAAKVRYPQIVVVPIVCLPASAFPEMPQAIRAYLQEQYILVPQVSGGPKAQPHNVISGDFLGDGKADWAVLGTQLSTELSTSFVLLFPDGDPASVERLWESPLERWCQSAGEGRWEFSRMLLTSSPKQIAWYRETFSEQTAPFEVTHDGIADYFVDKASTVMYFYEGKWHALPGMD